ncbi:NAC domain-containing protein 58-like [Corylus avellana]|uniref:NAC domain-containing protein 58-like n=1 Tax=Corylus avellana TaxID=13451 RepID=UPI00286B50E9|nr:NAC domain-containing protein 58-like [Corylus avellana]
METVENGKQNTKREREVVENGKQNIKREQAVAVYSAVDDQPSLWVIVKRQRVDDDDEEYLRRRNLPLGLRHGFFPDDNVLIEEYLKPKLFNQPLPKNPIIDMDIYLHSPEVLADDENQIKEWYYFTPRYRKYPRGSLRPRRSAGDGYWKATGAERQIKDKVNTIIGFSKTLVFYKGEPPKGQKTNWIMREYRLNPPPPLRSTNDIMRLDDCVLCRIYQKKEGVVIKAATSAISLSNGGLQQAQLMHQPPSSFDRYHALT